MNWSKVVVRGWITLGYYGERLYQCNENGVLITVFKNDLVTIDFKRFISNTRYD